MRTNVRIALVLALAGGAAMLGFGPRYLAADPPPRCPCSDPTPSNANINPAKFAGDYALHVCAFHVGKADPALQVESHHYCTPLRDGVFQCVIFDKDRGNAKLIGVEYIVSDDIFKTLPADEQKSWHPHDYEIRAGLLTMPGLKIDCEEKLLKGLLKSWGKVWHTWPDPKTDLPVGPPVLMWSAGKDGDVRKELVKARDERYKVDVDTIRKQREKL
ncbi:MAG TPA: DUF1264 domain-containing protein [Urbifossiella sp.]|nr:DUF1264 domain-containing protein [Urbifossiella sp.]